MQFPIIKKKKHFEVKLIKKGKFKLIHKNLVIVIRICFSKFSHTQRTSFQLQVYTENFSIQRT